MIIKAILRNSNNEIIKFISNRQLNSRSYFSFEKPFIASRLYQFSYNKSYGFQYENNQNQKDYRFQIKIPKVCIPLAAISFGTLIKKKKINNARLKEKDLVLNNRFKLLQLINILIEGNIFMFIICIGSVIIFNLLNVFMPLVVGELFNSIITNLNSLEATIITPQKHRQIFMKIIGYMTFHTLFGSLHTYLSNLLAENMELKLSDLVFHKLLNLNMHLYDIYNTTQLTEILKDSREITELLKTMTTTFVRCTIGVIGSLYHLYGMSRNLTNCLVVCMELNYLGLYFFGKILRKLRKQKIMDMSNLNSVNTESIRNIRTVRINSIEEVEIQKHKKFKLFSYTSNHEFFKFISLYKGLNILNSNISAIITLFMGSNMVQKGQLRAGDLVSYLMSIKHAQNSLDGFGSIINLNSKVCIHVDRVMSLLYQPNNIKETNEGLKPLEIKGNIKFDKISFNYNHKSETIFDEFLLDIKPNQTLAICGPSGIGKSTIVKLLTKLYPLTKGNILIDGQSLDDLDTLWLRRNLIAVMEQNSSIFRGSIMENIKYFNQLATDNEAIEAAKLSGCHDFILKFKNGYNTTVSEDGSTLSGGQKQRLNLARVILKKSKILILDEATSSLDVKSELHIQETLNKLKENKTIIIIAHRLSTIKNADKIVVLGNNHGNIVEMGTHDELLKKKGYYYNLVNKSTSH